MSTVMSTVMNIWYEINKFNTVGTKKVGTTYGNVSLTKNWDKQ